jgi:hypothetical protein
VSVYLRRFRTRGVYANKAAFQQETLASLNRDINPRVVREFNDIVSNWDTKVDFVVTQEVTSAGIVTSVTPSGPGAMTWASVSGGTPGHWIPVKDRPSRSGKGSAAMLMYRYKPKTSPTLARAWGGPGTYFGGGAYRRLAYHPGAKARNFEKAVVEAVRKEFYRFLENALRRAVRRAQREGT